MHQQLTPLHDIALYTVLTVAVLWTAIGIRAVWLAAFRPWAVGDGALGLDPAEQVVLSRNERRAFVAIANRLSRSEVHSL